MKKLHEKKLSELLTEWGKEEQPKKFYPVTEIQILFKQWAIAVVKNCKKLNETGAVCGVVYCPACQRFIDCFEITDKDLEG